jgi:putative Holliday junction resolvase
MALETFPVKKPSLISALGFDFGSSRIGVAFGQSLTGTAEALPVLKAQDGIPDWIELEKLIATWRPDVFIVGMPYNMDGSDSELLNRATKFGNRLNGRYHLPCYGIDERLSSVAAKELIGSNDRKPLDSVAAQLILENWFAELREKF